MSIVENVNRVASFTSSEIHRLMSGGRGSWSLENTGAPFASYVSEKIREQKLGRSLDMGGSARPAKWGTIMEYYLHETNKLGMAYQITSKQTEIHPTIIGWSGSSDFVIENVKISELKCYQPDKFTLYYECLELQNIDRLRKEFAQEYWQLVSNSIINKTPKCEAIAFMPYQNELDDIREFVDNFDYEGFKLNPWDYQWIYNAKDYELPYIPEGNKYYKDLIKFEFTPPEEDIKNLTERVKMAIKQLNKSDEKPNFEKATTDSGEGI